MRKKRIFLFLLLFCTLSLGMVNIPLGEGQPSGVIYIRENGKVEPATAPIQREGKVYKFTSDVGGKVLVVQRNHIVVDGSGHILQGRGERGVDLSYRSNVTIKNLHIKGCTFGVYLGNSFKTVITDSRITENMEGIRVQNASNNMIFSNNITGNHRGITLYFSSNNKLRENSLDNEYNFAVYGTKFSHFVNDVDTSNTIDGKKIYYLINERDRTIKPSTFPDLGFLALVNCTGITVQNLKPTHNGQGILLVSTTSSTITQNLLTNNSLGIGLFFSSNNIISENKVMSNNRGIQLSDCNNNGILTNNVTKNEEGIYLFGSSKNNVKGNNITDNQLGIGFRESSNNFVYHNYFINNTKQVYDSYMDDTSLTPSLNFWNFDYPRGGNYWSNYNGTDLYSGPSQNVTGRDGIGDTPYEIYGNNKDEYPLMPYADSLAVSILSPQNKTYTANEVPLNYTVIGNASWIGYSLNGKSNVTLTGNTTLTEMSEGTHKLTVYTKGTKGEKETSRTIYFTITRGEAKPFPIRWIWTLATVGIVAIAAVVSLFVLLQGEQEDQRKEEK